MKQTHKKKRAVVTMSRKIPAVFVRTRQRMPPHMNVFASVIPFVLLRVGPSSAALHCGHKVHAATQRYMRRASPLGCFVPGILGAFVGLRGGGAGLEPCNFCTKVHQKSVECRAGRLAVERAANGRHIPIIATMREVDREKKMKLPKGISEYGWGPSGYVSNEAGRKWEGDFCVLGIETSCDDTAAAVIHSDGRILGECKKSQDELSQQWGGVVPGLARDAHKEAISEVIREALAQANMEPSQLDAVGVTVGPGLEICLTVGLHAGRDLAVSNDLPFVSVHHLEAHILTARQFNPDLKFPFLVLLVSGGHCQILIAKGVGDYSMIGGTLDDSLGEAYDKSARMLGLEVGGGGGPALEALAKKGDPLKIKFGVPMRQRRDCNFSFAGLKTAVRLAIQKAGGDLVNKLEDEQAAADIAASFQHVAVTHLEERLKRAVNQCRADDTIEDKLDSIVVCGGVAANMFIRQRLTDLTQKLELSVVYPPPRLCTDNGVMVAWAAIERLRCGAIDDPLKVDVRARWPLGVAYKLKDLPKPPKTRRTKLASTTIQAEE